MTKRESAWTCGGTDCHLLCYESGCGHEDWCQHPRNLAEQEMRARIARQPRRGPPEHVAEPPQFEEHYERELRDAEAVEAREQHDRSGYGHVGYRG